MDHKVQLGQLVQDSITGYEGIAVTIADPQEGLGVNQ